MASPNRFHLRLVVLGALAAVASACTHDMGLLRTDNAVARTTAGPWASMVYLARTDSGVIAIDLGWYGASRAVRRSASALGASPADVRWVFLTHAHRDHIGAWPQVKGARFVLGDSEVPFFTGPARYRGLIPRMGDRMVTYRRPRPGEVQAVPVARDTFFALGRDTLRAFPVHGHTAGSTAYLFRSVLFVGDAGNWRPLTGFGGARSEFSDDVAASRRSMASLWQRLDSLGLTVRAVCTAHAKCGVADSALRARLLR